MLHGIGALRRVGQRSVRWVRTGAVVLSTAVLLSASACDQGAKSPQEGFSELRTSARTSQDPELVTDWLVAEMLRPGGKHDMAKAARSRLDAVQAKGAAAEVARGVYDLHHGHVDDAEEHFFRVLLDARTSADPRAPLLAWYAAGRVLDLMSEDPDFGKRHQKDIELLLKKPGNIGFRAYAVVVDMWGREAQSAAERNVDERLAEKLGCVRNVRLAGPFGENPNSDILRSFAAEKPGPWPERFAEEKGEGPGVPRRLKTDTVGCDVEADEPTFGGVFYAETYLDIDEPTELLLTASGSTDIWVNDALVHRRDVREWGVWPRFAARLHFPAGRHRVLWKMGEPATALRVVLPDGRPFGAAGGTDASPGYTLVPPRVGSDPNLVMDYIRPTGVRDPGDDLTRFVAAHLADQEGQPDVASVLFEPFVEEPEKATGIALMSAAGFVEGDPIFDEGQTRELTHELLVRAKEADKSLWYPRLGDALWVGGQKGPVHAVDPIAQLVEEFPKVPVVHYTLARLYEKLGWGPELERTVRRLVEQFPDNPEVLALGIELYEGEGNHQKADQLLKRLLQLNPDTEVLLTRALARKDYEAALAELRRLGARRPSREDISLRIADVMVRAGNDEKVWQQLRKAIEKEPRDVHARLALADAKLARSEDPKSDPLAEALVEAVQAGGDPTLIEQAIDLIEGMTALEPFRLDALRIIRKYEESGQEMAGTAVRVLDYGAVMVRSDGSSRFLEHEVVRLQSEEGIKQFTEMDASGDLLHLRVIKKDGRILEPEAVAGKPTVTMPHLEIGDYVEQERILSQWGDGKGDRYLGPAWFFREQNVAYARSEFVVVSPAHKKLQVETANGVPEPEIGRMGSYEIRRYRVNQSPAAPAEPSSPPASEFMPRVAVGWGLDFQDRLENLSRSLIPLTPKDPRIVRVAKNIVKGAPKEDVERARRLYHWVLDNVQEGEESDGRRVVISRSGNRWQAFTTLARALDIPLRWAVAESSLSSPIEGPISSAQRPLLPVLVVGRGERQKWLTIDDRFAPFGTVPGPLRGQDAYLLGSLQPKKTTVPEAGATDGIRYEGTAKLRPDGSADLRLRIIFLGKYAASLRNGLSQIPENQLPNIIESRLLGQELQGARLVSHDVEHAQDLDEPLIIDIEAEVPQFATRSGNELLVDPPFMPRLSQLTPLARRATPLLITDTTAQGLDLKIDLPEGMSAQVDRASASTEWSQFEVQDKASQKELHLVRDVRSEAGRISTEDYQRFQAYTVRADAALSRPIRIRQQ